MTSPYLGVRSDLWSKKTDELIAKYPLSMEELVDIVQVSWKGVFASRIGTKRFQIGKHIFPKPQILAFFLHELIPLELTSRYPGVLARRGGRSGQGCCLRSRRVVLDGDQDIVASQSDLRKSELCAAGLEGEEEQVWLLSCD